MGHGVGEIVSRGKYVAGSEVRGGGWVEGNFVGEVKCGSKEIRVKLVGGVSLGGGGRSEIYE